MKPDGPKNVPNYGFVQGIFVGCVAACVIILALLGPENHGSHFERGKTAFQVGASKEDIEPFSAVWETEEPQSGERSSIGREKLDA